MDLTNGQLTPNNNTPLLTQALSGNSTIILHAALHTSSLRFSVWLGCVYVCFVLLNVVNTCETGSKTAIKRTTTN